MNESTVIGIINSKTIIGEYNLIVKDLLSRCKNTGDDEVADMYRGELQGFHRMLELLGYKGIVKNGYMKKIVKIEI